jgi:hypothetical protein
VSERLLFAQKVVALAALLLSTFQNAISNQGEHTIYRNKT